VWQPMSAAMAYGSGGTEPVLGSIAGVHGWMAIEAPVADWEPHYSGHRAELKQAFEKAGERVGLYRVLPQSGTGARIDYRQCPRAE
jgi:hypothetical protein